MIQTITAQDVEARYEAAMAQHLAAAKVEMERARYQDNRYGDRSLHCAAALNREASEILDKHRQAWDTYAARCRAIHGAPDPGPAPTFQLRTTGPAAEYRAYMDGWAALHRGLLDDWHAAMR